MKNEYGEEEYINIPHNDCLNGKYYHYVIEHCKVLQIKNPENLRAIYTEWYMCEKHKRLYKKLEEKISNFKEGADEIGELDNGYYGIYKADYIDGPDGNGYELKEPILFISGEGKYFFNKKDIEYFTIDYDKKYKRQK